MTQADSVHSTPPTNTSVTRRGSIGITSDSPKPSDGITALRLTGPERELLAALLGYVAWGLEYGRTLEEMETAALQELELARRSAEKSRRQALRRSQLNVVAAAKKPWEAQGISQSMWYLRRQRARTIRNQFLTQVRRP